MELDGAIIARWLDPLARRPEEIGEVFAERRREVAVDWADGEASEARVGLTEGLSARWRRGGRQSLAFVSRCDEEAARDAIRAVQKDAGLSPLPVRPWKGREQAAAGASAAADRWIRRLPAIFARHAPRHRLRWTLREIERRVLSVRGPGGETFRRLVS